MMVREGGEVRGAIGEQPNLLFMMTKPVICFWNVRGVGRGENMGSEGSVEEVEGGFVYSSGDKIVVH